MLQAEETEREGLGHAGPCLSGSPTWRLLESLTFGALGRLVTGDLSPPHVSSEGSMEGRSWSLRAEGGAPEGSYFEDGIPFSPHLTAPLDFHTCSFSLSDIRQLAWMTFLQNLVLRHFASLMALRA